MSDKKLSKRALAAFALPSAPLLALALPTIVFLPPHYAAHLGLDLGVISAIFLAARSLDIITDPLLGGWQDRTVSRFGRRRLWLLLCTPVLMGFVWLGFSGLGPGSTPLQVAGVTLGLYLAFAAAQIAHLGWAGELRDDYHGRTNVLGAVQIAGAIGSALILLLPGIVRQTGLGDDAAAVRIMGWSIIIALPITVGIALWAVREPAATPQPPLHWRAAFDALGANASLRGVLVPDFLVGVAQGVSGGLFLFYFQSVLGFERESQTLLFLYFVGGLVGVPLWMVLGRAVGKHRALQIAFLFAGVTTPIILFLPPGVFMIAAPLMLVAGLHQSAPTLLLRAMMADVVDEDRLATGAQRSGLFYGLLLTTTKVGQALGPLSYAFLGMFGFQAALGAANTQSALQGLTGMFIGGPVLMYLASVWILRFYKLDEARQKALRAEIDARSAS
ncbi:MAG: MFS transporter [Hyphomonadaceae bacterium]|nr:MFS transporter [Hyphomonadaceae bacterium]